MTAPAASPLSPAPDGARLAVRVTPRGGREGVEGVEADGEGRARLRLRVAAAPVDGAANAAVAALVAKGLGLRRGDVTVARGATGRLKTLALRGEAADLAARLAAWIAREGGG